MGWSVSWLPGFRLKPGSVRMEIEAGASEKPAFAFARFPLPASLYP
jgi:hypothetical protein